MRNNEENYTQKMGEKKLKNYEKERNDKKITIEKN